ncbi:MAG: hypothetical protein Kow00129_07110 [Thermoleophilia bacterium]
MSDKAGRTEGREGTDTLDTCLAESAGLRCLEELIVGTSHELNNPLTSVQGLARLLAQEIADKELSEDLNLVASEADRAVQMVRRLREFVGPAFADYREPFDPAALVSLTCEVRRYESRGRGITLDTEIAADTPLLQVDRRRFSHLVLLAVLQAEKATSREGAGQKDGEGEGGKGEAEAPFIRVQLRSHGGGVLLRVSDSGPPVPPESHGHMFEPGGPALGEEWRHRSGRPGSLAAIASLARLLGAEVQAESSTEGGLAISVFFPPELTV